MTFERFSEIWMDKIGNAAPIANPIAVDSMSEHTIDALVAASHGDFSAFDRIQHLLNHRGRAH